MIKFIATAVSAVLLVLLIGAYLAPDDLSRCDARPSQQRNCQAADAIIAVSGGDTHARTDEAVALYDNGWADTLIFSGAAADKSGPSNASAMRQHAIEAGVPADAIIIEDLSETTHQNAQQSSSLFIDRDFRRVILVTSAYHQRRASIEFRSYAPATTQVVSHPVQSDSQWTQWWWLTPTGWWLAASELVKIVLVYAGVPR